MTNFSQKNIHSSVRRYADYSCLLAFALILFSSCSTTKTSSYFKDIRRDTVITMTATAGEELKIKKGDIVSINISSLSKLEDELYSTGKTASGASSSPVYQVSNEGEIYLHKVGKVKAEGLTRKQLKLKLEEGLQPYLKEPIVSVNFENHHITIMGEIGKPQTIQLPEEKLSIIDALAQSGNVAQTVELTNVMVIRENGNQKEIKHLNLEDHSIFASPYYYLQPNDVVVLSFNEKRVEEDLKRQKYQQVSSIVLQSVTMALIIYQTFFRK